MTTEGYSDVITDRIESKWEGRSSQSIVKNTLPTLLQNCCKYIKGLKMLDVELQ
jgi:hypothetical protein